MTIKELRVEAANLKSYRAGADVKEAELKTAIEECIPRGEAKIFADKIGVTPQYLSDIRNGRRSISDEFLERLVRLK